MILKPFLMTLLFLFKGIEGAVYNGKEEGLPFLKRRPDTKVTPFSPENIIPASTISLTALQSRKQGRFSFLSRLRGGRATNKIAPDAMKVVVSAPPDVVIIEGIKKSSKTLAKVNPENYTPAPPIRNFSLESINTETDKTETLSLGSPTSEEERNKFFFHTLSEEEVDLLYEDCKKFIKKGKFFIFRFALIKIESYITNERLIELLELAVKHKILECIEFLFDHFDHLAFLPSNAIFIAIGTGMSRIIEPIIRNRTVEDQNLRGEQNYRPYEVAAELNKHKVMKIMLEKWDETKLAWIPRAISMALSYESVETLNVIIENLKQDNIKYLNSVIEKFTIIGFINKSLGRKNMACLTALIDFLPSTFLKDNHGDLNYFKSNDIHLNPVIKAISVDFVKGLDYMVNHFGVEILKQVDDLGFSVFLIAAHYLSSKCTKYIATVCPDQIKNTDINGDNALHIAIKTNSSKVNKFVKAVADIGIDWEHKNSSGKTASALLNDSQCFNQKDIEKIKEKLKAK
jgi:hypothetical protein